MHVPIFLSKTAIVGGSAFLIGNKYWRIKDSTVALPSPPPPLPLPPPPRSIR